MTLEITMGEFDTLGLDLLTVDEEIKELEAKLKVLSEKKRGLADKIIYVLQKHDKTNYQIGGKKLIVSQRATVPTPKTEEEKRALFDWLKEKGVYWQYASVNSQALNALYKAERDAAVERQDLDFKIPGVGDEQIAWTLSIRK